MNIVRYAVIAALVGAGAPTVLAVLLGLGTPVALVAQGLVPKDRAAGGFSLAIQGQTQGAFPGVGKEGTIPGLRFSYLLTSPRDAASGLPAGKRKHAPVVFTKVVGTASSHIFSALVRNENLNSVVVSVPGGYTIKLTNASVSEVKQYTEVVSGAATLVEDVSFTFQKIEVRDPGTQNMAEDDWDATPGS